MNTCKHNDLFTAKQGELLFKYGENICSTMQSNSPDPMEVAIMLVLHLVIVTDLQVDNNPQSSSILRSLATSGGPLFLSRHHRGLFFNRSGLTNARGWTKSHYSAVRRSFDKNKHTWTQISNDLQIFRSLK